VLLKILYLLTCQAPGLVRMVFRGDLAKDAELLVLRHENAVLRRHVGRVRYEPGDRVWFAALARLVPRMRWPEGFPVTPATLLAGHRRLAARKKLPSGLWEDIVRGVMQLLHERCRVRRCAGYPATFQSRGRGHPRQSGRRARGDAGRWPPENPRMATPGRRFPGWGRHDAADHARQCWRREPGAR
jgi:hypothetical protein